MGYITKWIQEVVVEPFLMKDGESMHEYSCNLIEIFNQMRKFDEDLTYNKFAEKVLKSFPKKLEHAMVAIEESKDLSVLTIDELLGSLSLHEDKMSRYEEKPLKRHLNLNCIFLKVEMQATTLNSTGQLKLTMNSTTKEVVVTILLEVVVAILLEVVEQAKLVSTQVTVVSTC